jgi:GNAT superfamily N-acetyltransferase
MIDEWTRGKFRISTRRELIPLDVVHSFLTGSYWAAGIDEATVRRSIDHSLAFGLYDGDVLAGFGRVITDFATFAYIADVFVVPPYRGRGLGKWLVEVMTTHPELEKLRSWYLRTQDAHGLYAQFGFGPPRKPESFMWRAGGTSRA